MTRPAVASLLLAAALAGGCATDPDRRAEAEGAIAAVVAERLGIGADTVEVVCDDQVELEPGSTFGCAVTAGGGATPATLELAVADDGAVELRQAVIPAPALTRYLAAELEADSGVAVEVDCGAEALFVVPVGSSLTCSAVRTSDGATYAVDVEVTALDGTVRYSVERVDTTQGG